MTTEAIVFTFALFIGAAVTTPQGADSYQQAGYGSGYEPPAQPIISRHLPATLPKPYTRILKQDRLDDDYGSFAYRYETENGIKVVVIGYLEDAGMENETQVISGTYSYTAPDGTPINARWYADDKGFKFRHLRQPIAQRLQDKLERVFLQEEEKPELP